MLTIHLGMVKFLVDSIWFSCPTDAARILSRIMYLRAASEGYNGKSVEKIMKNPVPARVKFHYFYDWRQQAQWTLLGGTSAHNLPLEKLDIGAQ